MRKSYSVSPGHSFTYPADAMSLATIQAFGGLSKLDEEAKKRINMKTVREGGDCSDMPPSSRDLFVQRGWVIENVPQEPPVVTAPEPVEQSTDEEN
jgi:hypothetical protein